MKLIFFGAGGPAAGVPFDVELFVAVFRNAKTYALGIPFLR